MAWCWGKSQFSGGADLLTRIDLGFEGWKCQEISITSWAAARLIKLPDYDPIVCRKIVSGVARHIAETGTQGFKPQELSNVVWSMATAEITEKDLILPVLSLIDTIPLHRFAPQELNNICWGASKLLATLQLPPSTASNFYEHVDREVQTRSSTFKSQDVSTLLYALALVGYENESTYKTLIARCNPRSARFYKPQELSNSAWALATAGIPPDSSEDVRVMLDVVSAELQRRPGEFKPQEIKDVLWSLTKLGVPSATTFRSALEHMVAADTVSDLTPQGVGNMAWSIAKQTTMKLGGDEGKLGIYIGAESDLGKPCRQFFRKVVARVVDGIEDWSDQDLANTVYSFALLGLYSKPAFSAIASEVSRRQALGLVRLTAQEAANLLWSYSVCNHKCPALLSALCDYVRGLDMSPSLNEAANFIWSLTIFEHEDDVVPQIWSLIMGASPSELQWQTAMSLLQVSACNPSLAFPPGWLSGQDIPAPRVTSSRLQASVHSRALEVPGYDWSEEHVVSRTLTIDIADVGRKVGIEVDGPGHFVLDLDSASPVDNGIDARRIPNGSTVMKDRVLRSMGWSVAHVNFWEWNDCDGIREKETRMIQDLVGSPAHAA